jgi:type III secretion protein U
MSEKTLDPTPQRLEQARKEGQVPVSRDFARVAIGWPSAELAFALEAPARQSLSELFDAAMLAAAGTPDVLAQAVKGATLLLVVPAFVFAVVIAVLSVIGFWGQFGVLIAPDSLAPKPDRLDPIAAMKNLVSGKKLQELGLSMVKLVVLAIVATVFVRSELPAMVSLASGDSQHLYDAAMTLLMGLFRACMGVLLVLAIVDLAIQRMAHTKSLRMSLDEIIREYKENEGDPMVKGERRALAQELANSDPVEQTGQANAVVVNPTHFAIALFHDAQTERVPRVLAKGVDAVAQAMIARAQEQGIPVLRHVWLARTLYATVRPEQLVPPFTFDAVATVYAVADVLRERGLPYATIDESETPPPAA